MTAWYVVHTQPNAEIRALGHLLRQGFEPYLPRFTASRRHARKVEVVVRALFPRYLFVRLDLAKERWRAILSTVGVAGLVMGGDRPAAVPAGVIEEIRAREDEAGMVRVAPAGLRQGQKVRVTAGPLADFDGVFDGLDDRQRVIVLLNLMGRNIRVPLNADLVSAAD